MVQEMVVQPFEPFQAIEQDIVVQCCSFL